MDSNVDILYSIIGSSRLLIALPKRGRELLVWAGSVTDIVSNDKRYRSYILSMSTNNQIDMYEQQFRYIVRLYVEKIVRQTTTAKKKKGMPGKGEKKLSTTYEYY